MRAPSLLAVAVAVTTLLAGCGADAREGREDPARASTTGSTPTATPSSPTGRADGAPAPPEGTALQTAKHAGTWDLVLTDVRAGEHEGHDRLVLEFTGTGTPGWAVRYVDEAVLEGTGDVAAIEGDAILQLDVSGTALPAPGDDRPPRQGPVGALVDVYVGGTFEGYTQVFVGVEGGRAPFRVLALGGPPRLVVDVVADAG